MSDESPLPTALYRAEQVRELDRLAIELAGISAYTLMRRAGEAAFQQLQRRWPEAGAVQVFCGGGNNGGDGYVIARLAARCGWRAQVIQLGDAARLQGAAAQAREQALQEGVTALALADWDRQFDGVIVDALLGTGQRGAPRAEMADLIERINGSACPVLAVDVPSGLCADSGSAPGAAVRADLTVTFVGLKQGLLTGVGPDCCGELVFADLGIPAEFAEAVPASAERLSLAALEFLLPPRRATTHKGDCGHVLVIGGDNGMAGAPLLASMAALRCGAGLVSCATRSSHVSAVVARQPEVMAHGVDHYNALLPLLTRADVLVVGPGLGQNAWGEQMLHAALQTSLPLIVDADALNLLASRQAFAGLRRDNWLLTPHPGEAARLLGCTVVEVQRDRFDAAAAVQQRYGGAVILKGAGSLVASAGELPGLCSDGNPGMASGGMGDVLSGVLGALVAQGLAVAEAARLGTCVHARAADRAAVDTLCGSGQRGLIASDLLGHLRTLVN